jgi:hypothetical protein
VLQYTMKNYALWYSIIQFDKKFSTAIYLYDFFWDSVTKYNFSNYLYFMIYCALCCF